MNYLFLDVVIAFILDLIFGDPCWLPHPVRFIGWLINRTEKLLRGFVGSTEVYLQSEKPDSLIKRERKAGIALTVITVSITFFCVWALLKLSAAVSPVLFHVVNIYFIYSAIAAKCLASESKKVFLVLKSGDIYESRKRLAMLVGRETDNLNEKEIIRGVVETTAENTVDGVISPLIYAAIGTFFGIGAPLVYAFKAVSTLDSMVGYMNDKYIDFGRFSAKTDDFLNYIPARLSGLIIPLGALVCGMSMKRSFSIMLRDRRNHKSPNCAYPEAAFAGALGVRIGGNNIYFGKVVEKPTIGDSQKELDIYDIERTIKLMYAAAIITLMIFAGVGVLIS